TVLFGGEHTFVLGDTWEYHTVFVEPDAGTPDAETPDADAPDAETPDAPNPDARAPDASTVDARLIDAPPDSNIREGGAFAGDSDGGCGCRIVGTSASPSGVLTTIIVLLGCGFRFRRTARRRSPLQGG